MKIMIINPDYGVTQEEMDVRLRILQQYVAPDTELAMVCLQDSRVEINSALDVALAGPEIVRLAMQAQNAVLMPWCCTASAIRLSTPAVKHCRFPLSAARRQRVWPR